MKLKNILLIAGVSAVLAAVFIIARNYFDFGQNTAAALKSYQLYSDGEKQRKIMLYFGNKESDGFTTVETEIFESAMHVNQVKQALLLLLAGPGQAAVRVIPDGTILREVYVDTNEIVYADFSQEIALNSPGGSTQEYLTVYSVVKTVLKNFSWAKGVRILVEGREAETLTGHISIEGIFRQADAAGRD